VASLLEGKKEFEELINIYTDSDSPQRAGDFGWYQRGDIGSNPALEDAAFGLEMVGQFVGPIRAGNGFHFVKLTGIREEQSVPYRNARQLLRDEIISDKVAENLAKLVEHGLETMDVERNFELLNDPDADDSATLFRVEDFRYSLGRFRRAVMLQGLDRRSEQEEFLKRLLRNAIVYQTAVEAGYGRLDVEKSFEALINQRLGDIYLENEIDNRVQIPERELLARYEKEKDALRSPTRLHPHWILIRADVPQDAMRYQQEIAMRKAQQYANNLYYDLLLRNGEPFSDLAKKYSDHQPTKASGGDLGLYEGGTMGHRFDQVAFSMAEGEISHPVELRNGYCLIWLRQRFPSHPLSFDEARADLYRRMQEERISELKMALQKEIREGRSWTIDHELLSQLARFLLQARDDRILQAHLIE
jgi:parvulin-like peptidyl-prolyl isomerase